MTIQEHIAEIKARAMINIYHSPDCICVRCEEKRRDILRLIAALEVAIKELKDWDQECGDDYLPTRWGRIKAALEGNKGEASE